MQPTLTPVLQTLNQSAQPLEYLWQAYAHLWQSLGWNEAQLRLWLRCQPDMQVEGADGDNPTYRLAGPDTTGKFDLAAYVIGLLQAAGKPTSLGQIVQKLPSGHLVTETMLRTLAKNDPRLVQTGPLLRLA